MKKFLGKKRILTLLVGFMMVGPICAIEDETTDTIIAPTIVSSVDTVASAVVEPQARKAVKKVLFIGDSMTGWLSERLAAYGVENGFDVATVVWDGSTIAKWAKSGKLASIVSSRKPDAVFISLGLNELLERNPERNLSKYLSVIKKAIGDIPYVWVGPPSWLGKGKGDILNDWLKANLDENSFYYSCDLELPRQSRTNPHPTKEGVIKWMDTIIEWLPQSSVYFVSLDKPQGKQMVRGKSFVYKRMKESL